MTARRRGGPRRPISCAACSTSSQQIIDSDDFQGCIFVNVAMEFPLPHEPAHRAAAEHKRAIEAIVRELAEQAGAADPAALAQELCLVMEDADRPGDRDEIARATARL